MAQRKRLDFGPEVVQRLARARGERDHAITRATDVYEDALLDAFESGMTYREINDTVAGSHTTLTQQIKNARTRRSPEDPSDE